MKIKSILAVLALALAGVSFAKTDSTFPVGNIPYNSKGDVEPGEWTSQYAKAKAQAEAEDKPLLVYWGNNGCGHCEALERAIGGSAKFASWQKEYGIYMVFTIGGSTFSEAAVAKEAARDSSGQFPYIGVYWHGKKQGSFSGNGISVDAFISKTEALLKGYSPNQGGHFAVPYKDETDGHRYEAYVSAKAATVKVKLVREAKAANATGEDKIVVTGPDGRQIGKVLTVKWAKGDLEKPLSVSIPAGTFTKAGQKVRAVINGKDSNDDVYKTVIYAVNPENSATNPDFSGCTAFGEWTMDLGAAKTFAKDKGYVLVGLFGALWCHDCANTERNFLDLMDGSKNRFKEWAKSKNVALVMLDIPNFSTSSVDCESPCLLKADPYETTLAYEKGKNTTYDYYDVSKGGAPESLLKAQKRSGLGYMSRRGVSETAAKTRLSTFHDLAYKSPENGGYHIYFDKDDARNEDGNANRTGVPIFVLLRKDGTVAARLTRFASVSPMKADQSKFDLYIERFNEMLNTADNKPYDGTEIGNNYPSAGSIPAKLDESNASGRLTHADSRDSFKLDCNGAAVVTVTVESWAENAQVTAQFIQEQGGKFVNVGTPVSGPIGKGDSFGLTADFQKTGACYLLIKGDVTSPEFAIDSKEGTYRLFQVRAKATALYPQEVESKIYMADTTTKVKVAQGKQYRITGLGVTDADKLEKIGDDTYLAKVSGLVTVPVAQKRTTIAYQLWNPGKIAFASTTDTIQESAGSWKVKVTRSGASGDCKVRVRLNAELTDFYYDWGAKTLPRFDVNGNASFEYVDLSWKDGDKAAQTLTVNLDGESALLKKYYGDGQIVFDLESVGGSEIDGAKKRYTLKVKEDQDPSPSVIALEKANPGIILTRKVYARKSSSVRLRFTRDGSCLGGGVMLTSTYEKIKIAGEGYVPELDYLTWEDRDNADRVLTVSGLPAGGKSATIKIVPSPTASIAKWFKVDSEANYVKIMSVADDAPEFESRSVSFTAVRYVAFPETVAYNASYVTGGTLGFDKLKGDLPAGLTAQVDAKGKRLVFTGAPTAAQGTYTVYYQPTETRNGKKVVGIPVKIAIKVIDPVKVDPKNKDYGKYSNPSVKKGRLLESLMVLAPGKSERLAGTIRIYIPASGKISAKYMCQGGTIAFSADNWDLAVATSGYDTPIGTLISKPRLTTEGKPGYELDVRALPDGRVVVGVKDPHWPDDGELAAYSDGKVWSAADNSAKDWRGIYNATLVPGGSEYFSGQDFKRLSGTITQPANKDAYAPHGSGYLSFTMTEASDYGQGRMIWAGQLPGGQKVSGACKLTRGVDGWIGHKGYAYAPVYYKTSTDRFAIVAEIMAKAASTGLANVMMGTPDFGTKDLPLGFWKHADKTSGASASFSMDLHLFGSYYDPKKSLLACCDRKPNLKLVIDNVEKAGYSTTLGRGDMKSITALDALVTADDIRITSKKNPKEVTLKFNRATGLITGDFQLYYKFRDGSQDHTPAYWRGVLLTGWVEGCGCGDGGDDIYLPFICGGYYFNDKVPYKNGTKTVTFKGGGFAYGSSED